MRAKSTKTFKVRLLKWVLFDVDGSSRTENLQAFLDKSSNLDGSEVPAVLQIFKTNPSIKVEENNNLSEHQLLLMTVKLILPLQLMNQPLKPHCYKAPPPLNF